MEYINILYRRQVSSNVTLNTVRGHHEERSLNALWEADVSYLWRELCETHIQCAQNAKIFNDGRHTKTSKHTTARTLRVLH